jgi:hypothetical protein
MALRQRLRLQRRRINHRYGQAMFYAVLAAGLTVVIELAGWRGSYAIWGDPQNLTKVWWHFPLIAAGVFLGILFWPFHEDIDDEPRGW